MIPFIVILPVDKERSSNEKPSLRIARFETVTPISFSGFKLIMSDPIFTRVCVDVIDGSKPNVKFDVVAENNFSEIKSVLPVLIENTPEFKLKFPEIAGKPEAIGVIKAEKLLPENRVAALEAKVNDPLNIAFDPFEG